MKEGPKNTDKELMEALLAGKTIRDGYVDLRLGKDGFLESYAGEPDGKWVKREDILSSISCSYKRNILIDLKYHRLELK